MARSSITVTIVSAARWNWRALASRPARVAAVQRLVSATTAGPPGAPTSDQVRDRAVEGHAVLADVDQDRLTGGQTIVDLPGGQLEDAGVVAGPGRDVLGEPVDLAAPSL